MGKMKKYRQKVKKVCPKHHCKLLGSKTVYGLRFECPQEGCTVVCWDGSTSTPADYETRSMRIRAHEELDSLYKGEWRNKLELSRLEIYKLLATALNLKVRKTHIGYFDIAMCLKVIVFTEHMKMQWFQKNELTAEVRDNLTWSEHE